MNDFLAKLPLYKTAYSPLYECYVGIHEIVKGADNQLLLRCFFTYEGEQKVVLFNVEELEQYCL